MERPKLKIQLDNVDVLVEIISLVAVLLLIFLPLYYYGDLPDRIPTHFNASGAADSYSGKSSIFILPIIGASLYIGMYWLNKYPHIFNYSVNITEHNAKAQYTAATKLIRFLNLGLVSTFTYICFSSIQISLGKQEGLSSWFLPIFILLFLVFPIYYAIKMHRKK